MEEEKKETQAEDQQHNKEESRLLDEPIPVKEIILMYLYSLEGKAWAYLGLTSHPETRKPKKDLAEARRAIDAIDALFKAVEDSLTAEEKKEVQVQLANLRLNFAGK